jgi:hypothetical protein
VDAGCERQLRRRRRPGRLFTALGGEVHEPVGALVEQLATGPGQGRERDLAGVGVVGEAVLQISADTGTSTAQTIEAACARASSRSTEPSSRPSVVGWPLLVVAGRCSPCPPERSQPRP